MTTYKTLSTRIRNAATIAELRDREEQITRHYNNGTISVNELSRLDSLVMERIAKLEE